MPEDAYFFFDMDKMGDIPEEEHTLSILCVPCRNEHHPGVGWFWNGSKEGYGPWKYICCRCSKDVNFDADEEYEEHADG